MPAALCVPEVMFGTGESFTYRTCGTCGSAWQPGPPDLDAYYGDGYYAHADDPVALVAHPVRGPVVRWVTRAALRNGWRRWLAAHAPHRRVRGLVAAVRPLASCNLRPGTRVLDVGCGAGVVVQCLATVGAEAVGVDPYAAGDRTLRHGARAVRRAIADVEGPFDVVMFHHSLEHMPDPVAALRHAARLAPGGHVVVRCPTVSSHARRRFGPHWIAWDAPRHLVIPSREGMRQAAGAAGLRVVATYDDATTMQWWASDQARRGVALMDADSRVHRPWRPRAQWLRMPWWAWRTRRLNARGAGDAVVWILRPAVPGDDGAARDGGPPGQISRGSPAPSE